MRITLVKCKTCKGTGYVDCCNDHMCPGHRECYECDGKGKHLTEKLRKLKKKLEKLQGFK